MDINLSSQPSGKSSPPGKGWLPAGSESCIVVGNGGMKRRQRVEKPCDRASKSGLLLGSPLLRKAGAVPERRGRRPKEELGTHLATERARLETLRLRAKRPARVAPRPAVTARPGSESRANLREGCLGTWEIPKPPGAGALGTEGEGNEAGGKGEGSLSVFIVPVESRESLPEASL